MRRNTLLAMDSHTTGHMTPTFMFREVVKIYPAKVKHVHLDTSPCQVE